MTLIGHSPFKVSNIIFIEKAPMQNLKICAMIPHIYLSTNVCFPNKLQGKGAKISHIKVSHDYRKKKQ